MKTNSAIILISDLHLMSFKVPHTSKTIESKIKDDDDYIECFFESVKKQLSERSLNLYALVIAGDIANSGKTKEYEKAKYFLNKAIEKLGLIKENIILVPGNHDINWTDIDLFIDSPAYNGEKKEFELHDVKFSNFKIFYDTILDNKAPFIVDSSIVELKIDEENNLIILALNSNYYESNCSANHFGFIKHDKLRELLDSKLKHIQHKNYGKIAILHHQFSNFFDKNDIQTLTVLNNFGFHAFLHGHVHNDYSNANQDSVLNYFIGVGSFAKKDQDIVNSYKLLFNPLKSEDFNIVTFHYSDLGTLKPYWQEQTDITAIKNFCIKADPIDIDKIVPIGEKLEIEIVNSEGLGDSYSIDKFLTNDSKLFIDNKRIILDEIREKKLFKTGHFHWSDNFRSHGLIDIYTLINSNTTKKLVIVFFI
jgi:3',5'-cyclic AMP phosphodiesterase CpdA